MEAVQSAEGQKLASSVEHQWGLRVCVCMRWVRGLLQTTALDCGQHTILINCMRQTHCETAFLSLRLNTLRLHYYPDSIHHPNLRIKAREQHVHLIKIANQGTYLTRTWHQNCKSRHVNNTYVTHICHSCITPIDANWTEPHVRLTWGLSVSTPQRFQLLLIIPYY